MYDKNLDSEGYLTFNEHSSSIRRAVSAALREIDFHSNGNTQYFRDDLIYGRSGLDRFDVQKIQGEYYDYTSIAVFLFAKGYLKVLIKDDSNPGSINAEIFFPAINMKTFKSKIQNIDGPVFTNYIQENLHSDTLRVYPITQSDFYLYRDVIFSIEIKPNEINKNITKNGSIIYGLKGNDIFFPIGYYPATEDNS